MFNDCKTVCKSNKKKRVFVTLKATAYFSLLYGKYSI